MKINFKKKEKFIYYSIIYLFIYLLFKNKFIYLFTNLFIAIKFDYLFKY